jgi:hypothetical protein
MYRTIAALLSAVAILGATIVGATTGTTRAHAATDCTVPSIYSYHQWTAIARAVKVDTFGTPASEMTGLYAVTCVEGEQPRVLLTGYLSAIDLPNTRPYYDGSALFTRPCLTGDGAGGFRTTASGC